MIAALRSRNFNEFAQLLEEKSNVKYLENEEIINEINTSLQSLRAAIYGARGVIGDSYCIRSIIKCMEIYSPDIGIQSQGLNILYYLVDHPPNCQKALENNIVKVITTAMKSFKDDKKIQANACGIIWVIAKSMKINAQKDQIDELIELINNTMQLQHFQNLEVGNRNPYRFKIVVPERALHRLKEE